MTRTYVYGNNIDEALQVKVAGGSEYYYHTNVQGNVVALTDASGAVIEKIAYDVYGRITKFEYWDTDHFEEATKTDGFVTPATYFSCSLTKNTILFQGRNLDVESGLHYFRNRQCDPVHGRFLSRDPMAYHDSYCLYQFCNNNPVCYVDPRGLMDLPIDTGQMVTNWGNAGSYVRIMGFLRARENGQIKGYDNLYMDAVRASIVIDDLRTGYIYDDHELVSIDYRWRVHWESTICKNDDDDNKYFEPKIIKENVEVLGMVTGKLGDISLNVWLDYDANKDKDHKWEFLATVIYTNKSGSGGTVTMTVGPFSGTMPVGGGAGGAVGGSWDLLDIPGPTDWPPPP